MSEDVVELQETQQEDRLNNHHASENKKDNSIRIEASKQNKQETMVEALRTDNTVKTLKASEQNSQYPKKNRSVSLHPGNDFQSNKLRASVRKQAMQNRKNRKGLDGSNEGMNVTNTKTAGGRKMLRAGTHASFDVHHEDESEAGSLLGTSHHHHHIHLPKFSLSPPDNKDPSKASQFGNHLGDPDHLLSAKELSASQLHLLLHPTEEKDDAALRDNDNIICLNVGGKRHWAMWKNFVNFPGTRLGRLARAKTNEDIIAQCDKYFPQEQTDCGMPEYFFDHSWIGFNSILDVYRNGTLHLMSGVCALVTKAELEYWGIDELLLEPCCALKYYPEIELCCKEVEGEELSRIKSQERKVLEDFGPTKIGKFRKYLWNLTEYPETSRAAQVTAFVSLGVIVVSTICFILSTFPEFNEDYEADNIGKSTPKDNDVEVKMYINGKLNGTFNSTNLTTSDSGSSEEGIDLTEILSFPEIDTESVKKVLHVIDIITVIYFSFEYVVRFCCSPHKAKFFIKPMNLVDFLAILPYIISFFLIGLQDLHILSKAGKIMRLVRVMRILRIFKLVRHFAGLQSLLYTLKQAYKELGLLVILVAVAVLTFSSLVFYAEKDSPELKWTFLDSFWWGLMTLTTVGYGTQTPSSITGKAIGGFCAIVGVFILTLPVPIVVNSFASYYKNRLWRNEVAHKRRVRAAEQAKQVKEILVASAAVGNEENIGCIEDADEIADIMRRPSTFSVFGQRPSSPRSNRSNSNQSIPTHPNSLNSDDEEEHVGSDVEKEKLQEDIVQASNTRRESEGGEVKPKKKKTLQNWRQNSGGFRFFTKTEDKGSSHSIQTEPTGSSLQLKTNEKGSQQTLQPPTLLVTLSPPSSQNSNTKTAESQHANPLEMPIMPLSLSSIKLAAKSSSNSNISSQT